ncbi:putative phosphoglycerate mutase [Kalaharituber pfeilii]|nr:putative phosphoglycerate mutase [Kalaharituber pfeilii]
MSVLTDTTPRVFLARHGETEWTLNGRYTGVTDLPLTPTGALQVAASAAVYVGPNRLIDPRKLTRILISPRRRAQETASLLFGKEILESLKAQGKVATREEIAEWGYGRYEGWLANEIRADRKKRGLDTESEWDVWKDGCEDGEGEDGLKGEAPSEVAARIDKIIAEIRELHREGMKDEKGPAMDIVLVSHSLFLRAFTKRWLGCSLDFPLMMLFEPGGIGILSYTHHNVNEPAFVLGSLYRAPA